VRLAGARPQAPAERRAALRAGRPGLPTVGAVAALTRSRLLEVPGIGRKSLSEGRRGAPPVPHAQWAADDGPHTLDRIWELASRPLTEGQRIAVERSVGITGEPEVQGNIAATSSKCSPDQHRARLKLASSASTSPPSPTSTPPRPPPRRLRRHRPPRRARRRLRSRSGRPASSPGAGMVRLLVRVAAGPRAHRRGRRRRPAARRPPDLRPRDPARLRGRGRPHRRPVAAAGARDRPPHPCTGLLPTSTATRSRSACASAKTSSSPSPGTSSFGPRSTPKLTIGFVLDQTREPPGAR
jgi:hypothetical protein